MMTPATLRVLVHGRTFHGGVLVDEQETPVGMTYYAREGGLGKVVRALRTKRREFLSARRRDWIGTWWSD